RGTSAARVRRQASHGFADGLVRAVDRARSQGAAPQLIGGRSCLSESHPNQTPLAKTGLHHELQESASASCQRAAGPVWETEFCGQRLTPFSAPWGDKILG